MFIASGSYQATWPANKNDQKLNQIKSDFNFKHNIKTHVPSVNRLVVQRHPTSFNVKASNYLDRTLKISRVYTLCRLQAMLSMKPCNELIQALLDE